MRLQGLCLKQWKDTRSTFELRHSSCAKSWTKLSRYRGQGWPNNHATCSDPHLAPCLGEVEFLEFLVRVNQPREAIIFCGPLAIKLSLDPLRIAAPIDGAPHSVRAMHVLPGLSAILCLTVLFFVQEEQSDLHHSSSFHACPMSFSKASACFLQLSCQAKLFHPPVFTRGLAGIVVSVL